MDKKWKEVKIIDFVNKLNNQELLKIVFICKIVDVINNEFDIKFLKEKARN